MKLKARNHNVITPPSNVIQYLSARGWVQEGAFWWNEIKGGDVNYIWPEALAYQMFLDMQDDLK